MSLLLALCLTAAVWVSEGTDSLRARLDRLELQAVALRPGLLELAPALSERTSPSVASVWRAVPGRDASTWLGTGNGGAVYRIGRSGQEKVFESEATQVMALVVAADGTVFFGLTPKGEVWRVRPGGKPELHFATGESYVYDLAFGPDGALYAATGPAGRLYRIDGGTGNVVFAAPQLHLTCVEPAPAGLLVGTAPDGIVYRLDLRGEGRPVVDVLFDTPLAEVRSVKADGSGGVFIAANPAGESGDTARVFYIDAGRVARWSWACPDSTVFDVARTGAGLLVATGSPPRLYELDTEGRAALLHRFAEGQVVSVESLAARRWLVGTANPGRLFELDGGYADSGFVTSTPFDCGAPARLGRLEWMANVPNGTMLEFDLRWGHTEKPDSTWAGWGPWGDRRGAGVAGRYVQWRARLGTRFDNLTPRVERVDLYYSVPNRAPGITRFDVAGASPADARLGRSRPVRELSWDADDADGDSLEYRVEYRARGEERWLALGRPTAERRVELDTRALADGWYEARVWACDRPTRGTAALERASAGRAFAVDNTGPVASITGVTRAGTGKGRVRLRAVDALTPIVACRVAVNAAEWQAVDVGAADALDATFEVEIDLPVGDFTVAVWAADAQGNTGAGRKAGR